MMFKTIIFSGVLFAAACASTETAGKPKIATLAVLPNFDQGHTYKDFRVHYSGAGEAFEGKSVSIKIYKKDANSNSNPVHEFTVETSQVNRQKAYYFGLNTATPGDYEVDVCDGSNCSGRNPALTSIKDNAQKDKITCEKGDENDQKQWVKQADITLDMIGADEWITESHINSIETALTSPSAKAAGRTYETEWTKNKIQSNPSYDQSTKRIYSGVIFNIVYYRELFMKKDAPGAQAPYARDFCKRKYLLSYHVHILEKNTHEVMLRFKKTLYLSKEGKQYFIYSNTKEPYHKVHVELTSDELDLDVSKQYEVWVSFCATEKDENDSTVCSNPFIRDLNVVSGSD